MTPYKVQWRASLSNGQTFYEGKGDFVEVDGEKSPWQKLLSYLSENKIFITSLSLYTEGSRGMRTFNLPSAGNNPRFAPFELATKPLDFRFFRTAAFNQGVSSEQLSLDKAEDLFSVIEAVYGNYRLQLWVDEKNTRNSWVLVVPNDR